MTTEIYIYSHKNGLYSISHEGEQFFFDNIMKAKEFAFQVIAPTAKKITIFCENMPSGIAIAMIDDVFAQTSTKNIQTYNI